MVLSVPASFFNWGADVGVEVDVDFCLVVAIPRRQSFNVQAIIGHTHNYKTNVHINGEITSKQMSIKSIQEFSFSGEEANEWMSYKLVGLEVSHIAASFLRSLLKVNTKVGRIF